MMRRSRQYRRFAMALAALAVILVVLDQTVGGWQQQEVARRAALKARLDRLSFDGLRTGIDEITFDEGRYFLRLRVQNAAREPFFILAPTLDGFVQVGLAWEPFHIRPADGEMKAGTVLRLVGERIFTDVAAIEGDGYAEPIPGYRHVKITLEAFVSPEENPQEEIGERHEDFFLFIRDAARDGQFGGQSGRPSFIPLRAWTLLPKDAL